MKPKLTVFYCLVLCLVAIFLVGLFGAIFLSSQAQSDARNQLYTLLYGASQGIFALLNAPQQASSSETRSRFMELERRMEVDFSAQRQPLVGQADEVNVQIENFDADPNRDSDPYDLP